MAEDVRQNLYERIVREYQLTHSVREAAHRCGASLVTAQRVLITEGLWRSKRSEEIGALWADGKTVAEIAAALGVSENSVRAYLPYSRGKYGAVETMDSNQSRAFRTRMQKAEAQMRQLHQQASDPGGRVLQFPGSAAENEPVPVSAALPSDLVYHLRLELATDYDARDQAEFLRLARAERGISREILAPGDMTLHGLHYAIQRLFGWQNSHLHHFSLPQADFAAVTGHKVQPYWELCGILFRVPDTDPSDRCWDDDYRPVQSVKTWLARKYTRPFRRLSMADTLIGAMDEISNIREALSQSKTPRSLTSLQRDFAFEEDLNSLNEGVALAELLRAPDAPAMPLPLWQRETQQKRQAVLDAWSAAPQEDLREAMRQLRTWRSSYQDWDQALWLDPEETQRQAQAQLHLPAEAVIRKHQAAIRHWEAQVLPLTQTYRVSMTPQFDTVLYYYDYGDSWMVRLTVQAVYDVPQAAASAAMTAVQETGKPLCIAADGLSVMDDCGGAEGYLHFLRLLDHGDPEAAAEAREWAREMGWNSRRKKPENML